MSACMVFLMTLCTICADAAFVSRNSPAVTQNYRDWNTQLFAAGGSNSEQDYNVKAAKVKLPWERLEDSMNRPVLNLSSREQVTEEFSGNGEEESNSVVDWDQGQIWVETQRQLQERGMKADLEEFLKACPQLLRLPSVTVMETADWVIQEFGLGYLEAEPRFLGYRPEHLQYGLEFMSTMMMMDAKAACQAAPALLLSGIEGGIQEKAVEKALGAASAATSKASQSIAGDAMAAIQALKKRPKGLQ